MNGGMEASLFLFLEQFLQKHIYFFMRFSRKVQKFIQDYWSNKNFYFMKSEPARNRARSQPTLKSSKLVFHIAHGFLIGFVDFIA